MIKFLFGVHHNPMRRQFWLRFATALNKRSFEVNICKPLALPAVFLRCRLTSQCFLVLLTLCAHELNCVAKSSWGLLSTSSSMDVKAAKWLVVDVGLDSWIGLTRIAQNLAWSSELSSSSVFSHYDSSFSLAIMDFRCGRPLRLRVLSSWSPGRPSSPSRKHPCTPLASYRCLRPRSVFNFSQVSLL